MGISVLVLAGISIAMAAMQAQQQNEALEAQSQAAARQAEGEISELGRRREFADTKAAADKSERVRESERANATMLVGMADMGGAGSVNEARMSQEVGFYEGLDLARLEGNRVRQQESLKSEQVASKNRALNIAAANTAQKKANNYKFISSSFKTAASSFGGGAGAGLTTAAPIGGQANFDLANSRSTFS